MFSDVLQRKQKRDLRPMLAAIPVLLGVFVIGFFFAQLIPAIVTALVYAGLAYGLDRPRPWLRPALALMYGHAVTLIIATFMSMMANPVMMVVFAVLMVLALWLHLSRGWKPAAAVALLAYLLYIGAMLLGWSQAAKSGAIPGSTQRMLIGQMIFLAAQVLTLVMLLATRRAAPTSAVSAAAVFD